MGTTVTHVNQGFRMVATPGFLAQVEAKPAVVKAQAVAFAILRQAVQNGGQPSWVIGNPAVTRAKADDGGRTLHIPAPFKFYAIRDDHEPGCDCGCDGQRVVTFLLPEEY